MTTQTASTLLSGFARKRELWWQFTVRAVEMRHRGSYFGLLWAVFSPLLMLGLYGVVFGFFFHSKFNELPNETGVDYALGMFLGLILFQVVAETVGVSPSIIVTQPNLVKKVVFPLAILPLAQLGAFWFHFLMSLALLLLGALVTGRDLTFYGLIMLPVIAAPLVLLTIGLSWLLASLGVFFRDIGQLAPFLTQIILWTSAVPFSPRIIPAAGWVFLKWNPLLHTVQMARQAVLWHTPINPTHLAYTWICGAIIFLLGAWTFRKMQPAFADVL